MRYVNIPEISFTAHDGRQYKIKEFRDIPPYDVMKIITKNENEDFDEIASRQDVFGDGSEILAYELHEANITKIIENRMDYTKIKRVTIPNAVR